MATSKFLSRHFLMTFILNREEMILISKQTFIMAHLTTFHTYHKTHNKPYLCELVSGCGCIDEVCPNEMQCSIQT